MGGLAPDYHFIYTPSPGFGCLNNVLLDIHHKAGLPHKVIYLSDNKL